MLNTSTNTSLPIYIRKAQASALSGRSLATIDRKIKENAFVIKRDGRSVLIETESFKNHFGNLPTSKSTA